MLSCFQKTISKNAIPIVIIPQMEMKTWQAKQDKYVKNWLQTTQFNAEAGSFSLVPDESGKLIKVLCCVSDINNFWSAGALPFALPEGEYYFELDKEAYESFAMAWGLGAYQFDRYKKPKRKPATCVLIKNIDVSHVENTVAAIYSVRDLINTPTDDMGPSELAEATNILAKRYLAKTKHIVGEKLLKNNYPCIYTVGRASDDAPRLIDMRWGQKKHPLVVLVGKGVCFDTGGLDLKPSSAMLLMKKDMGGAAHVLGLAQMIMRAKLNIQLRVLIPAVENSVSGNAYRPGDIIKSRKGITIEIGNTDAEGRVVLADALTEAVSESPDLLIDIATLTGAARIALGTELPAVFSNNDKICEEVIKHSYQVQDPVWRLPLFNLYRDSLKSSIADINNCGSDSYGGAITAALFLKEFVPDDIPWLHYDLMAWNIKTRPGRPQGGEAMGLRGLCSYLKAKYS